MTLDRVRMILVVGSQRSGTTLAGQLLGAPEHRFLIDEPDGVYDWLERAFSTADKESLADEFRRVCRRARDKYTDPGARCDDQGGLAESVTDIVCKVPNVTHRAADVARTFPDALCVFLLRDIRDVVVSMARVPWVPIIANQRRLLAGLAASRSPLAADARMLLDASLEPFEAHALIAKLKMGLASEFRDRGLETTVLRFESLVRTPDAVLDKVLPRQHRGDRRAEPEKGARIADHGSVYRGVGPGATQRDRQPDVASVGNWHHALTPAQQGRIWQLVGDFLEQHGYPKWPPGPGRSAWNSLPEPGRTRPLILAGMPREAVRRLAERLEESVTFLPDLEDNAAPAADCREWNLLLERLVIVCRRGIDHPPEAGWAGQLRDCVARLLIARGWDGSLPWGWLDSDALEAEGPLCEAFPEARWIVLVEHPVGYACSSARDEVSHASDGAFLAVAYRGLGWPPDRIETDPPPIRRAACWMSRMRAATACLAKPSWRGRILPIRIEDLVADMDRVMRTIAGWAGLRLPRHGEPWRQVDPGSKRTGGAHADAVWAVCGDLATSLGYEPPAAAGAGVFRGPTP